VRGRPPGRPARCGAGTGAGAASPRPRGGPRGGLRVSDALPPRAVDGHSPSSLAHSVARVARLGARRRLAFHRAALHQYSAPVPPLESKQHPLARPQARLLPVRIERRPKRRASRR